MRPVGSDFGFHGGQIGTRARDYTPFQVFRSSALRSTA
jgi:hypothetical protein